MTPRDGSHRPGGRLGLRITDLERGRHVPPKFVRSPLLDRGVRETFRDIFPNTPAGYGAKGTDLQDFQHRYRDSNPGFRTENPAS
jgi:hypothetical protein